MRPAGILGMEVAFPPAPPVQITSYGVEGSSTG
jgi:hypothetical protein